MINQLALFGGAPTVATPFPQWPIFDQQEVMATKAIVSSGQWDHKNPVMDQLEQEFAQFQGTDYAIAVTNGSQTMEIILRALGIGIGDEVIVPAYTFVATAMAVLMVGATPIVVDVRPDTMTIDPDAIRSAITERTKAVMPVHIAGVIGAIAEIVQLAKQHNLYVIEDCAHAHGASFRTHKAGSLGIAGSFSFQGGKVITAGEGGIITTNDPTLYEACLRLREGGSRTQLGSNYRMTAIQAAIIRVQLQRFIQQRPLRLAHANRLDQALNQIDGITPQYRDPLDEAPGYLYLFYYDAIAFNGLSRKLFVKALQSEGVPCGLSGYPPLYRTDLFQELRDPAIDKTLYLSVVEQIDREVICIPHQVLLGSSQQIDAIAQAIQKIQDHVCRGMPTRNSIAFTLGAVQQKIMTKLRKS